MPRPALVLLAALLTGCGRYEDITLPEARPQGPVVQWRWEPAPQPVLTRGAPGEWDSSDVLNPTLARWQGRLLNLYSGFDGHTWHTGLADSPDGVTWTKRGRILSPGKNTWEGDYIAANGAVIAEPTGELLYLYQASRQAQIGLARSRDGRTWTKEPAPVIPTGPRGSWDELAAADPYLVRFGRRLYCFYLGMDRARRQRLGVAASSDGVTWTKHRGNPILEVGGPGEFDERGLGEPAVWFHGGRYYMLYTGRDAGEVRRLGFAVSEDGTTWRKLPGAIAGDQPWNQAVLCDPHVEPDGNTVRVWFGGGDRPSPDERLNGQIGYGVLRAAQ